jgi:hypothetical protein
MQADADRICHAKVQLGQAVTLCTTCALLQAPILDADLWAQVGGLVAGQQGTG